MSAETRLSLLDTWIQENNAIVKKWEQRDCVIQDNIHSLLKRCHLESHKLLLKIQGSSAGACDLTSLSSSNQSHHQLSSHVSLPTAAGIPAVADHAQLELIVVYNGCVFSLSESRLSEAEQVLMQGLKRGLEGLGWVLPPPGASLSQFWSQVSAQPLEGPALRSCLQQLLCVSWALWLATCQMATIRDMQETLLSLSEGLRDEGVGERRSVGTWREGSSPPRPQVVLDPGELRDLLQICTVIAQGADWLAEGRCSEALCVLQTGPSLPAPRAQLALTHFLSGLCLARTGHPQGALQCFRKAIEVDSRCVSALHQSTLVYQQLGNTQAEIQGLQLLHSMLMLPPAVESGNPLLRPSSLLRGQSLSLLLSAPSPLGVLHSLALKNVLHGRLSEGAELYLDLLAELQSGNPHTSQVGVADALPLPRLPELYLEAGSALLAAKRPADALALCDEVIDTTLDLLPQKRLNLEEEELVAGSGFLDRLETVLWAGSAHLLQAHCQAHLKDWRQAVDLYTRCINLVVKVRVLQNDRTSDPPGAGPAPGSHRGPLLALRRLKGLALAGRGISFTQRDQLREALRDLQLSLQASAGCMQAELWLGEVLWRLGRRQEATSNWKRAWNSTREPQSEGLPVYLQDPQSGPSLVPADLQRKLEEFTSSLHPGGVS